MTYPITRYDEQDVIALRDGEHGCQYNCPLEYDGTCTHPDAPEELSFDVGREIPSWCPLRTKTLTIRVVR